MRQLFMTLANAANIQAATWSHQLPDSFKPCDPRSPNREVAALFSTEAYVVGNSLGTALG